MQLNNGYALKNFFKFFLCFFLLSSNIIFSARYYEYFWDKPEQINNNIVKIDDFINNCPAKAKENQSEWQEYVKAQLNNDNIHVDAYNKWNSTTYLIIEISKEMLLNSSFNAIQLLSRIEKKKRSKNSDYASYFFLKKELVLLNTLPDNLLRLLKTHLFLSKSELSNKNPWPDSDPRIQFKYQRTLSSKKIQKTILKNYIRFSLLIIPTLLYSHFFVEPIAKKWEFIQPPSLLEENKKKEFTNQIIKNAFNTNIPDNNLLIYHPVPPIEFEWVLSFEKKITYYLTKISAIIIPFIIESYLSCPIKKKSISQINKMKKYNNFEKTENNSLGIKDTLTFLFQSILVGIITIFGNQISELIFSYGTPLGLISIACIPLIISLLQTIIESYNCHKKIILFNKKQFEKKSFKEIIEYYLNKKDIIIL